MESGVQVAPGARKTVLVVDDEPLVLGVLCGVLESRGYAVLSALSAEQALALYRRNGSPVDLLLADVMMPGMSGPELAERLLEAQPGLRVLFIAGMPDSQQIRDHILSRGFELLAKPFLPVQLLRRVDEVLAERVFRAAGRG